MGLDITHMQYIKHAWSEILERVKRMKIVLVNIHAEKSKIRKQGKMKRVEERDNTYRLRKENYLLGWV